MSTMTKEIRRAITEATGFEFDANELQEFNEHDLMRVIDAVTPVIQDRLRGEAAPEGQAVAELKDPALLSLIARFLQERDEALTPDDYSDAERTESARLILKQVNEFTVPAAPAPVAGDGFERAFYEIAEVLQIGVRSYSPKITFQREMLPRIRELYALAQDRASQEVPNVG